MSLVSLNNFAAIFLNIILSPLAPIYRVDTPKLTLTYFYDILPLNQFQSETKDFWLYIHPNPFPMWLMTWYRPYENPWSLIYSIGCQLEVIAFAWQALFLEVGWHLSDLRNDFDFNDPKMWHIWLVRLTTPNHQSETTLMIDDRFALFKEPYVAPLFCIKGWSLYQLWKWPLCNQQIKDTHRLTVILINNSFRLIGGVTLDYRYVHAKMTKFYLCFMLDPARVGEIQWFGISRAADPCRSGTMWFQ